MHHRAVVGALRHDVSVRLGPDRHHEKPRCSDPACRPVCRAQGHWFDHIVPGAGNGVSLNIDLANLPFLALVDDDQYSAQLLMRALVAHGAPDIQWYGDADAAQQRLTDVLADPAADWPGLLIVDLKAYSGASRDFVALNQALVRQKGIPVVVMTPADSSDGSELRDAGASALFTRHAQRDAYRREAAAIVSFWAHSQRLDAVGM